MTAWKIRRKEGHCEAIQQSWKETRHRRESSSMSSVADLWTLAKAPKVSKVSRFWVEIVDKKIFRKLPVSSFTNGRFCNVLSYQTYRPVICSQSYSEVLADHVVENVEKLESMVKPCKPDGCNQITLLCFLDQLKMLYDFSTVSKRILSQTFLNFLTKEPSARCNSLACPHLS